jgi:CRISPR/Cas system-associated exonuclease Cas4 (RecB family)
VFKIVREKRNKKEDKERWLTPTSINTYLRCPRKFYYRYKLRLETKPNIHLIRGNIVHKTLELFFKFKLFKAKEYYSGLRDAALDLFDETWRDHSKELQVLDLQAQDLDFYYDDSRKMILNWLHLFLKEEPKDFNPITEKRLFSKTHRVYAIADIIKNGIGIPHIIDYKTSKSMTMYDEYRLQLAIQSLCYCEEKGFIDHRVGIHFLKYPEGLKLFKPSEKANQYAIEKIKFVRANIQSNDIQDYPCTCGGWCKKDFVMNAQH